MAHVVVTVLLRVSRRLTVALTVDFTADRYKESILNILGFITKAIVAANIIIDI